MKQTLFNHPAPINFTEQAISDRHPVSPALRSFLSDDAEQHLIALRELVDAGDLVAAQQVAREVLQRLDIDANVLALALTILPEAELEASVHNLWSSEHLRVPLLLSLQKAFGSEPHRTKQIVQPLLEDQALTDPALFHLAAKLGHA